MECNVTQHTVKYSSLESQLVHCKDANQRLEVQRDKLMEDLKILKQVLETCNIIIDKQLGDNNGLQVELDDKKSLISEMEVNHTAQLEELKGVISGLREQIEDLTGTKDLQRRMIKEQKDEIYVMNEQVQWLNGRIDWLKNEVRNYEICSGSSFTPPGRLPCSVFIIFYKIIVYGHIK